MNIGQNTKRTLSNPFTIASLSSVVTIVISVVGGIFFLDDRYAHAESVLKEQTQILERQDEIKKDIEESISSIVTEIKINDLRQRILDVEDEIFLLNLQGNLTTHQVAHKERLDRRLSSMRLEKSTLEQQ